MTTEPKIREQFHKQVYTSTKKNYKCLAFNQDEGWKWVIVKKGKIVKEIPI